jgi:hypothetical protein
LAAGETAKTTIAKEKPGAKITLIQLDLTDFTSVEACAQQFIDSGLLVYHYRTVYLSAASIPSGLGRHGHGGFF